MAPIQSGIKRRHFLKALGTALLGVAAAKVLPVNGNTPTVISFHERAFAATWPSTDDASAFRERYIVPAVEHLAQTIDYDAASRFYCRMDVICGWSRLTDRAVTVVTA